MRKIHTILAIIFITNLFAQNWVQFGNTIYGDSIDSNFGNSLSFDSTGQ